MDNEIEDEFIYVEAREPSLRDKFFLEWGLELVKKQFDLTNELLKQQISICVGLFAASFIFDTFLKEFPRLKATILFLWLSSLIMAFIGLMPFERKNVLLDSPSEIEDYTNDAIKFKKCCYTISAILILVGLSLLIIKLFFCDDVKP
jgi:hypothetical protein